MKWNVEEANPKTGHYRTLTVDAPDQEAAEAFGRLMGLKDGETKLAPPLPGKVPSSDSTEPSAPPARRLATHWIVLMTAAATVACTVTAIKVVKPLLTAHASNNSANADVNNDLADLDQPKLEQADADKPMVEVAIGSNDATEPNVVDVSTDAKETDEQPALDLLPE